MQRVLIFSGTTEGRKLTEMLSKSSVPVVVCVATEYGEQVMDTLDYVTLHKGRMSKLEMQEFMKEEKILVVVDATHPFAIEVSKNIRQSAKALDIQYLRLQRDVKSDRQNIENKIINKTYFSTNEECATALSYTKGNILLTTGSKELEIYCRTKELRDRLYVRVLPSEESIRLCKKQGLMGKQIIAMHGPFSKEMNMALISQYNILHMVTKESGFTGGFEEKISASEEMRIDVYVIGNPEKSNGLSFVEVCKKLESLTKVTLNIEKKLDISLIGMGMGNIDTLTIEAKEKIENADYLFGAKRLISCLGEWKIEKQKSKIYPYYMSKDIIPVLEEILHNNQKHISTIENKKIVILFSGDSGFYSGCQILYERLKEWNMGQNAPVSIKIYPGISSVSYFAAACRVSWQDAKIISIHGKGRQKEWEGEVVSSVRYHKKVFIIVSGVEDVRTIGAVLCKNGLKACNMLIGYQLSYKEEKIIKCTPEQCEKIEEEGLYILAIFHESSINKECEKKYLVPHIKDKEFIRGEVPMTKEEIREIVLCKLKLFEDAIVYDIGSGTGSVAVEIAKISESICVYAVEQKEEAIKLIYQNKEKFNVSNIEVTKGHAPDCLTDLLEKTQIPTHVFIGGSGGKLKDILNTFYKKNSSMHVVITAVSLETIAKINEMMKSMPIKNEEILQLQVSRSKKVGKYNLMNAENPVYICSFEFYKR